MITETGQSVLPTVKEKHKPEPEPGLVLNQLQLMVVLIVLGKEQKLTPAYHVKVYFTNLFLRI